MTYEEFKKELYRNLQLQGTAQGRKVILLEKGSIFLDEDTITLIRLVNLAKYGKEDNVLREDTICVAWKSRDTQGLLHWSVREIYRRFKSEGWQSILPEMVNRIQGASRRRNSLQIENYVPDSESMIVKPLYYPYHREELEDGIFWMFGDIALTLFLLVCDTGEEVLTMKLNRDIMGRQVMADEALLTNALLNTYVKMPPKIYYDRRIRGYHVTTTKRVNGAVAFFYPGIKERLAELSGGDYYVGFTSVHEALVYPTRNKVLSELKAYMSHAGVLCERREMLTDRVYRYSCSRRELIEV